MADDRFKMVGARAATTDGPVADVIGLQLNAIESALENVPDFAFDLSKTLIESVCKTVLADLGLPADSNWDMPRLLKETIKKMSLLPRDHPDPNKASDSVEKTVRGLAQTIQGLCELRNSYGMASHGRDILAARLDLRQATLAAQAADTIVSFLYCMHRDAVAKFPGDRVYYQDHMDFNEYYDAGFEEIKLGKLKVLPSRVLFHVEPNTYKAALVEFIGGSGAASTDGSDGEVL